MSIRSATTARDNQGYAPQYYVENSHEAIIPKDLFMKTQAEIKRRKELSSAGGKRRRAYSSKYALSGKVICAHCGDIYRRIKWNNNGCKSTVWRCVTRLEQGKDICPARTMREDVLKHAVVDAFNTLAADTKGFMEVYRDILTRKLGTELDIDLQRIEEELHAKQVELLGKHGAPSDDLIKEIYALRDEQDRLIAIKAEQSFTSDRVNELMTFISENEVGITEYDDNIVRKLVERIVVDDEKIVVEFYGGAQINIDK